MNNFPPRITLADIFAASFRPMTETDKEDFAGLEGTGRIATYLKDGAEYLFVMDEERHLVDGFAIIKIEVYGENLNAQPLHVFEIEVKERGAA